MTDTSQPQRGFTIVELLIVIVIIGILAALVITFFTGVRERAYNAAIVGGVKQYLTGIEAYRSLYGYYPKTQAEEDFEPFALTCLGRGYQSQYCGKVSNQDTFEDALFYQNISEVMGSTSNSIAKNIIHVQNETFVGAVYGIDDITPSGKGRTIQYALLGTNANCVLPGSYAYNLSTNPPTTACEIVLEDLDNNWP